jgi:predicted metallo-beta-lactamase superfamily hydrolase
MIFKYLNRYNNLKGYLNKCYYDSYDKVNFSKKPTTIFSNKKMLLKKTNVKNNNNRITTNNNFLNKVKKGLINIEDYNIKKDYCERSRVPIELYKHILSIYEGKEQLNLF